MNVTSSVARATPHRLSAPPELRPKSILLPEVAAPAVPTRGEISEMMRALWQLNTRPGTFDEVRSRHLRAIIEAWEDYGELSAAWCGKDKIVFKIAPSSRDCWARFCFYDVRTPPQSTFGFVTDRPHNYEWPQGWQNYGLFGQAPMLDHCCGEGSHVRVLREQGRDAYGTDATAFDSKDPYILYAYERLPFKTGSFGLVESRYGVFFTGRNDPKLCTSQFQEIVRVTDNRGLIRIFPIDDQTLQHIQSAASGKVQLSMRRGAAAAFVKRGLYAR